MKSLIIPSLLLLINFPIFISKKEQSKKTTSNSDNIDLSFEGKKSGNKNYFTIPLKVGTPPITFNVQVDTSVSTSWLPSIKCKNCIGTTKFYDETKSKTSFIKNKKEIELDDEDGDVEGYETKDYFTIGEYTLKNFSFIQVTEVDDDEFRDHYEGKLGLGYRGELNHDFNFVSKLKKDKLITKRIFSINQKNSKKGTLSIGDVLPDDNEKYAFCNVTSGEDLDDIYKESWVCELTHVGIFEKNEISENLNNYSLISNGKVDFDSAYDYIAVPFSDRQIIDDLLIKANLNCEVLEKNYENINKKELITKFNEEEIDIFCNTTYEELETKKLALSFVLQGNVFSIPLELLFSESENGKMEMLVKYINDNDAIWTFGYPFISQYVMIFNMEDNHVGILESDKTKLNIISIDKEWNKWYDAYSNLFYKKINITVIVVIAVVLFCILALIVAFLIIRAVKKRGVEEKKKYYEGNFENNIEMNRVY